MADKPQRRRTWFQRLDRLPWLGPGLVMAATAIGASHLVLAPTAGAAFGTSLLWIVTLSHLYKYPAFDFGPRFAVATGEHLLDGYARIPGPDRWAVWVFLVGTVVQGVTVLAGVLSVAAAVLHAIAPGPSLTMWSALLGLFGMGLLAAGRFDALSAVSKAMLTGLALMTMVAFAARPPEAGFVTALVVPELPSGSLLLVAALLGWMPTGLDVSVWHSMWALERRAVWSARAGGEPRRILGVARVDLGVGYGLSLVLGVAFLALGVTVLRPAGLVPQGAEAAITIARLYTDVLGPWALMPFLTAALFGMASTAFGVLDGFPRAFDAAIERVGARPKGAGRRYWGFMITILVLALVEIGVFENPVALVTIAAVVSFLLAPITYACNTYCVTRLIEDPALRPGAVLKAWAAIGMACATAAALLFLTVRF